MSVVMDSLSSDSSLGRMDSPITPAEGAAASAAGTAGTSNLQPDSPAARAELARALWRQRTGSGLAPAGTLNPRGSETSSPGGRSPLTRPSWTRQGTNGSISNPTTPIVNFREVRSSSSLHVIDDAESAARKSRTIVASTPGGNEYSTERFHSLNARVVDMDARLWDFQRRVEELQVLTGTNRGVVRDNVDSLKKIDQKIVFMQDTFRERIVEQIRVTTGGLQLTPRGTKPAEGTVSPEQAGLACVSTLEEMITARLAAFKEELFDQLGANASQSKGGESGEGGDGGERSSEAASTEQEDDEGGAAAKTATAPDKAAEGEAATAQKGDEEDAVMVGRRRLYRKSLPFRVGCLEEALRCQGESLRRFQIQQEHHRRQQFRADRAAAGGEGASQMAPAQTFPMERSRSCQFYSIAPEETLEERLHHLQEAVLRLTSQEEERSRTCQFYSLAAEETLEERLHNLQDAVLRLSSQEEVKEELSHMLDAKLVLEQDARKSLKKRLQKLEQKLGEADSESEEEEEEEDEEEEALLDEEEELRDEKEQGGGQEQKEATEESGAQEEEKEKDEKEEKEESDDMQQPRKRQRANGKGQKQVCSGLPAQVQLHGEKLGNLEEKLDIFATKLGELDERAKSLVSVEERVAQQGLRLDQLDSKNDVEEQVSQLRAALESQRSSQAEGLTELQASMEKRESTHSKSVEGLQASLDSLGDISRACQEKLRTHEEGQEGLLEQQRQLQQKFSNLQETLQAKAGEQTAEKKKEQERNEHLQECLLHLQQQLKQQLEDFQRQQLEAKEVKESKKAKGPSEGPTAEAQLEEKYIEQGPPKVLEEASKSPAGVALPVQFAADVRALTSTIAATEAAIDSLATRLLAGRLVGEANGSPTESLLELAHGREAARLWLLEGDEDSNDGKMAERLRRDLQSLLDGLAKSREGLGSTLQPFSNLSACAPPDKTCAAACANVAEPDLSLASSRVQKLLKEVAERRSQTLALAPLVAKAGPPHTRGKVTFELLPRADREPHTEKGSHTVGAKAGLGNSPGSSDANFTAPAGVLSARTPQEKPAHAEAQTQVGQSTTGCGAALATISAAPCWAWLKFQRR